MAKTVLAKEVGTGELSVLSGPTTKAMKGWGTH